MPEAYLKHWCGSNDHKQMVVYYEAASDDEKSRIDGLFDKAFDGISDTWKEIESVT